MVLHPPPRQTLPWGRVLPPPTHCGESGQGLPGTRTHTVVGFTGLAFLCALQSPLRFGRVQECL